MAALAVAVAAIASLEGWGRLVVAGVVRAGAGEPPWDLPGVRGAIGIAVLSSLTGFLVLVRIPAEVPFWTLAAAGLAGWAVRPPRRALRRDQLPVLAFRLGLLALLAVWITVWALAHPQFEQCDDNVAYVPFVNEVLHVGGLDEPFSQRRIGTLGTFIPIEFWGYLTLGPVGSLIGDAIVSPLLAAMALLWTSRRWPGLAVGAAGALVAALAPVGRLNLGPSGITMLMVLVAGLIAAHFAPIAPRNTSQRRPRAGPGDEQGRLAGALVAAVVAGQLVGFRLHYALVALVPVALIVFWPPLRLRIAIAAAAGLVIPILGWSLAALRDTGTPLFPLLGNGTLNPDWNGYKDPLVHGFGTLFDRSIDVLAVAAIGPMVVAMTIVAAIFLIVRRDEGRVFAVPLGMALAALATIAVFPVLITTAPAFDSWRLTRPLVVGPLLVLIALLSAALPARIEWRRPAPVPAFMLASALALAIWVGQVSWSEQLTRIRTFGNGLELASNFDTDPYRHFRYPYQVLERYVPGDATVAYAVDLPALLDDAGAKAYNLDVLGANSPEPGLPYFQGAKAKLDYLRGQGIDYLVTVDPDRSACLYSRQTWEDNLKGPRDVYQLWAPYFFDWFADFDGLTRRNTTQFDILRLTKLRG